jgi:hypothetical protein
MQTHRQGEPPFAAFFSIGTNYTRKRSKSGGTVYKFTCKFLQQKIQGFAEKPARVGVSIFPRAN